MICSAVVSAQSAAPISPRLFPVRQVWTLPLNSDLAAPPAMVGTFGYFPLSGDRLAAFDIEHGTLLWLVKARPTAQPAPGGPLLFVLESGMITALRQQTGSVAWRIPFADPLPVPLVWSNGWLLAATTSGTVLAFRATDGALIWRREVAGGLRAQPAIAVDRVYLSTNAGQVVALRIDTGDLLWERQLGGQPNEILPVDKRVYVGSTDNYFYALDTATGDIAWRWSTGADVVGLPVADDRRVYFVSFDNVLRALDRRSGSQIWKRPLPLRPTRGPVQSGDALIVSGVSRSAPAFFLKDGAPAGELPGGGELATPPHPVNTGGVPMLVIVTRDFTDGTVIRALQRSYEPSVSPIGPMPNPILPDVPGLPKTPPAPTQPPSAPR